MVSNKIKRFFTKKTVLVIGIFSPRKNTGISNNFEVLINGLKAKNVTFSTVKIPSRSKGSIGSFHVSHSIKVIRSILQCWIRMLTCRNICHQVAFSKFGFLRDLFIIWPAALLGKKIFIRVHSGGYGIFYENQLTVMKLLIRLTLERTYIDFDEKLLKMTTVVPNGIDVPGKPEKILPKTYKATEIFRILYLSNLIESKGYLDVLKACQLLKMNGEYGFFCDFCGDFITIADERDSQSSIEREARFSKLIKEWDLSDHVAYHGLVIGKKKAEFFEKAHVFILPTNYLWEGQPLSIIEALSFGVPVIATPYRAIPDQVIDGYNGLLVNYGYPDEIKTAINRMKSGGEFYKNLSRNALKHYSEKFTQEKHLDLLIPLITQK